MNRHEPRISDLHIAREVNLPSPRELRADLPVPPQTAELIARSRQAIIDILHGRDPRLLVVAGPCSIHDPASALEYAARLRDLASKVQDALFLILRVYFEKPRTRLGWKGLIYDPDLNGGGDIRRGLRLARHLLIECSRLGLPAASEILDLVTPQFYAELLSWGAIGARTVESPLHRQMASALSAPVGFKNPTHGALSVAIDALISASQPHTFPSISVEGRAVALTTTGNPNCHLILRGASTGPNYESIRVRRAATLLRDHQLPPRLMVDCSHANSGKDPRRQMIVAADLAAQVASGSTDLCGVMIESHLVEGRQDLPTDPAKLRYGQSITDPCLGWEDTVSAIENLAQAVRRSRFTPRRP